MPDKKLYEPLQDRASIRLFQLLPRKEGSSLQGRLLDSNLADCQAYEAISYVWGSEADKVALDCDGFQLLITQNLAAALRRIRLPETNRVLWIDSICINQNDVPEKNHQVRLMSQIYRKASRVLVWLGEEDENGEDTMTALTCMDLLQNRVFPRLDELRSWKDKALVEPDEARNSKINAHFKLPRADSAEFIELTKLFRRSWFSRAWTFQETFVARERSFLCGGHCISGVGMLKTFGVIYELYHCTKDPRYSQFKLDHVLGMTACQDIYSQLPSDLPRGLLSLLWLRRGAGCKDPRDLLYSVLGAAADRIPIEPDYGRSFEHVYATSTAQIISATGSLNIFGQLFCEIEQSALPTWVPDWRSRRFSRGYYGSYSSFTAVTAHHYFCTGSSKPHIRLSPCAKEIILQGLDWDVVKDVKIGSCGTLPQWLVQQYPQEVYGPTQEPLDWALLRLFCTDRALSQPRPVKPRWEPETYQAVMEVAQDPDARPALAEAIACNSWNKGVAITQNSFLGLVPDWAKPGDRICWLMGGEVPILLRADPTDGKYTVIGECYIHGAMDGEVLVEARRLADVAKPSELADTDRDESDTSWLNRLHEEPLPFSTTEFTIK
ncbi:MAG: hypothetical protein Q9201_006486 [Fulgogasparrea decipioides]